MNFGKESQSTLTFNNGTQITKGLACSLSEAIFNCGDGSEEQGGFLISKGNNFKFVKVENTNTGQPIAVVEYRPDLTVIGAQVFTQLDKGWGLEGSFHTHPGSCTSPSMKDLSNLFTSYPTNFIYSPQSEVLSRYQFSQNPDDGDTVVQAYDHRGQPREGQYWVRHDVTKKEIQKQSIKKQNDKCRKD